MKLSVDTEFYDFLDSKVQNEQNRKEVKSVVEDLSEISFEGTDLQTHYSSLFGGVYHRPDGFVQFVFDTTELVESYFSIYNFNFSVDNCLRVLVFEALRPFMLKKLKKQFDTEKFGSDDVDVIYFYLQETNIDLDLQEHLYFSDQDSNLNKFISGVRSSIKSAPEKIETSKFESDEKDKTINSEEGFKEEDEEEFNFEEEKENEENENKTIDDEEEKTSGEEEAAAAFEDLF